MTEKVLGREAYIAHYGHDVEMCGQLSCIVWDYYTLSQFLRCYQTPSKLAHKLHERTNRRNVDSLASLCIVDTNMSAKERISL
jgi:hypothetical protein